MTPEIEIVAIQSDGRKVYVDLDLILEDDRLRLRGLTIHWDTESREYVLRSPQVRDVSGKWVPYVRLPRRWQRAALRAALDRARQDDLVAA